MSLKKGQCKNHPKTQSTRRCYFCKEYICKICQNHYLGHLFCGKWCFFKYKCVSLWKQLPFTNETRLILSLILITNIITWYLISQSIQEPVDTAHKKLLLVEGDYLSGSPFELDTLTRAAQNELTISIKSSPGILVALSKNGKFIESKIAEVNKVEFTPQSLEHGNNYFSLWALYENGKSVMIDSFHINYYSPKFNYLKKSVSRFSSNQKWLALTFDGGSISTGALEILNILKQKSISCTMFLTGRFIQKNRELVQKIISDGHEIANHTHTHPHLTQLEVNGSNKSLSVISPNFIAGQLRKADSVLQRSLNHKMVPFWRAPFGEINDQILSWAAREGYKHIGWSERCDSRDWVSDTLSSLYRSNHEILEYFINEEAIRGVSGKIILMHLGTERKSDFAYDTLPELIDHFHSSGYQFKTISQLISAGLKN